MAPMKRPRQGASMFSESKQQDLRGSEFTAIGRDRNTVNIAVHVAAPPDMPGFDQPLNDFSDPEEDSPKPRIAVADSRRAERSPHRKSANPLRRWLSKQRKNTNHIGAVTSQPTYDSDTPPLTPDSSCASSPSSSQEDITLSSTFELGPQYLKLPYLTIPQVYVKNMLKSGKGLACWKPEPLQRPHTAQQVTAPGDVGTFSAEGGFKKIFNIWDDATALRLSASRFSHAPIRLPPRNVTVELEIAQGGTITMGASSDVIRCSSGRRKITSFKFRCQSQSGAILAATSSADLEQLEDYAELREWLMEHAELVYKHTNKIRRIANDEALFIITGCTKSDGWALAAFERNDTPPYNDDLMCLEDVTHNGGDRPTYGWTKTWSSSEARSGSSQQPGLKDQTLFVRGFKLDFSDTFRNRMKSILYAASHGSPNTGFSTSPGPSGSPEGHEGPGGSGDSRQGGHGGQHSSGTSSSSRFGGGRAGNSLGGTQRHSHSTEHRPTGGSPYGHHSKAHGVSLTSFPDSPMDSCHPSDDINKHLLDLTGADFAICHDDEWRFALKGLDTPDDLLQSVFGGSKIVTRHGVASLEPNAELPLPAGEVPDPETPSPQLSTTDFGQQLLKSPKCVSPWFDHFAPNALDGPAVKFRAFFPYTPNEVKHRKRTTSAQLNVLEGVFRRDTKPNASLRNELAAQLDMTARSVQVWFQNRRAKEKTKAAKAATNQGGRVPPPKAPSSALLGLDDELDDQMLRTQGSSGSPIQLPDWSLNPPQLRIITGSISVNAFPPSSFDRGVGRTQYKSETSPLYGRDDDTGTSIPGGRRHAPRPGILVSDDQRYCRGPCIHEVEGNGGGTPLDLSRCTLGSWQGEDDNFCTINFQEHGTTNGEGENEREDDTGTTQVSAAHSGAHFPSRTPSRDSTSQSPSPSSPGLTQTPPDSGPPLLPLNHPKAGSGVIILLMGHTGAWKSHFINAAAGKHAVTVTGGFTPSHDESIPGHFMIDGPLSHTHGNFILVDTPGFDNCHKGLDDARILRDIASWLEKECDLDALLGGFVYFHDITQDRGGMDYSRTWPAVKKADCTWYVVDPPRYCNPVQHRCRRPRIYEVDGYGEGTALDPGDADTEGHDEVLGDAATRERSDEEPRTKTRF